MTVPAGSAVRLAVQATRRRGAMRAAVPPALLRDRPSQRPVRAGQYSGARHDRPNTRGWRTLPLSPDADTIGDLPTLRARVRDCVRNMPLAASALLTFQACVIGRGLVPRPMIDAAFLGITEKQKDAIESAMLRHWRAWARSRWSSWTCDMTMARQEKLALTGRLLNGDHWVVIRRRPHPRLPYSLTLQHIEADLVSTPTAAPASPAIVDGVELDDNGVAVAIHVANHYPHDTRWVGEKRWARVPIFGDDNERMVLHVSDPDRTGQTRGVPRFAPVLEVLKAKSDWVENAVTAALNSTVFTLIWKTPRGTTLLTPQMAPIDPETGQPIVPSTGAPKREPVRLGAGNVVSAHDDETLEPIESKHPMQQFGEFNAAIAGELCAGVGLPREMVTRQFTASFSASKGAINEGWKVVRTVRGVDEQEFLEPVWRRLMTDLAIDGLLELPGFFEDPLKREAYLQVAWAGPLPGHLNPLQEANAIKTRLETLITTLDEETAEYNGGSAEANMPQQGKERRWAEQQGLRTVAAAAAARASTARASAPLGANEADDDLEDDSDEETTDG